MQRLEPGILSDQLLTGQVVVERDVMPPLDRLFVGADLSDASSAVRFACGVWGGVAQPLLPFPLEEPWETFERDLDTDRARCFGVDESLVPEPPFTPQVVPNSVVRPILSAWPSKTDRPTIEIPTLDKEDPWYVAYLSAFGDLEDVVDRKLVELGELWPDTKLSDVVDIKRVPTVGSVQDFTDWLKNSRKVLPIDVSLVGLTFQTHSIRITADLPTSSAGDYDEGIVLILYEPGSVLDLCLAWNLRAAWGWPPRLPIALPMDENVVENVRHLQLNGVQTSPSGFSRVSCSYVTSLSVERSRLHDLVGGLDSCWEVAEASKLLRSWYRPRRRSYDIVSFDDGLADVPVFDSSDRQKFDALNGMFTITRFRPSSAVLPPVPSLVDPLYLNGGWRGGAFEVRTGPRRQAMCRIAWPSSWTVLEAVCRDKGLRIRRSQPGRAATALALRVGPFSEISKLQYPSVMRTLYQLDASKRVGAVQKRLNSLITDGNSSVGSRDRLNDLAAELERIAVDLGEAQRTSLTASVLRKSLEFEDADGWIAWAVTAGVLERGATARCQTCGQEGWLPLDLVTEAALCRYCGSPMPQPFGVEQMYFSYRPSDALLGALFHDSLGHLLTLDWMIDLFSTSGNEPGPLVGGYPGVEFLHEDGQVILEADVLLLSTNGSFALGEYKRTAAGLNENVTQRFANTAEDLGAAWTFVATHEPETQCGDAWTTYPDSGKQNPRYALPGERLWSLPISVVGSNPLSWPSGDDTIRRRRPPPDKSWAIGEPRKPYLARALDRHFSWIDKSD